MKKRLDRNTENQRYASVESLAAMLDCGRSKAAEIGAAAGARIKIGASVRYSVNKVCEYMESLTEKEA